MSAKQRIGIVGAGLMGHGIAKNLVEKGFPLAVRGHRNRAPIDDLVKRGAKEVKTNADLARNADIVILCVTGAPQVQEVVLGAEGLASGARQGLIVIDTSTSEPATTAQMREALAAKGVRFVDAPLARTPVEAELGKLNIMVGASSAPTMMSSSASSTSWWVPTTPRSPSCRPCFPPSARTSSTRVRQDTVSCSS